MNINFLTETTLVREASGATPVQDLLGNTGPLRVLLDVGMIGNTQASPGASLRQGKTVLEVSVEDSPDGASEWREIHRFSDHTFPHGLGMGQQRAVIGAFQPFVRCRYRLHALQGAPLVTLTITGSAPTAAVEE